MKDAVFGLHANLEQRHWWFGGRRAVVAAVVERIMPDLAPTIVDVGCGTGGTVDALSKRHRCIGIDSSELAIRTARELYPRSEFRCGVVPRDLQYLQSDAGLYLIMDVLEHIENDEAFLASLIAFARPGSAFLITVPAWPTLWSAHDVTAGHFRRYEPQGLRALWQALPVRERLFSSLNYRLYPIIRAARRLGQITNQTCGSANTDFSLPPEPINKLLSSIFAGEKKTILSRLDRSEQFRTARGVSLVALLQKNPAEKHQ